MPVDGVLSGKVAVVTGAGRGIGRAIAVGYAAAGAAVCCVARTESDIARTVLDIRRDGGTATSVQADVTDHDSVVHAFGAAISDFGGVDIVVINAGSNLGGRQSRPQPRCRRRTLRGSLMLQNDSAAICVAGAVIRDNMVLLVHRSPSARFWPDVWDLFGGHVNEGESLEEALQREAREELGIDALALRWLGRIYDPVEPAIVHVYAVSSWEGEPVNAAPEEHTEVRWFSADELPETEGLEAYRTLVVTALG